MIQRYIQQQIQSRLGDKKITIIYGPRQSGKTTLVQSIIEQHSGKSLYVMADIPRHSEWLRSRDDREYTRRLHGISLLVIDEAQTVPDIGLILKNLHDLLPNTSIIATGSSSFELAQLTQEPLTGRKRIYHLMPLGIHELYASENFVQYSNDITTILLYGLYPEVYTLHNSNLQKERIYELIDANLFKDILLFEGIRRAETIVKLTKMLAYQIGKPVSLSELSNKLGISIPTVDKYITILEQAFIVFRLGSYTKNLRKELSKSQKIYFWDIGIRNGLIDMFQSLDLRGDRGELRENLVIAEHMKKKLHTKSFEHYYFWRTSEDQEIDLISTYDEKLTAYEIKYSNTKAKIPDLFFKTYPHAQGHIITVDTMLEHL